MSIARKGGELIYDEVKVAKRWKELVGYNQVWFLVRVDKLKKEEVGETIMEGECKKAIQQLKDTEAPGIDDIPAELIKKSAGRIKKGLYSLVCEIYETEKYPKISLNAYEKRK